MTTGITTTITSHGHDHGHHPYPHAEHPLGPKTLAKMNKESA